MTRGGGARRPRHAGRALLAAAMAVHCGASPIPPRQISHSGAGAYEAALTATGDGFVASWYDVRDGNGEVYLRRIDARGEPVGAEIRLTRNPAESYEPSLDAFDDGRLALAWYDKDATGALVASVGVWTPDGTNVWSRPLPAPSRNPVLAASDGTIVVAWIQTDAAADAEDVWVARMTDGGHEIGGPRRLGRAHRTTWNVNLDVACDGSVWVVWDAVAETRASELFLSRVTAAGASLTRLTTDDGYESKYPDIALRGDRAALTWFDARDGNTEVYLVTGRAADLAAPIEARAARITDTPGSSIGAYLVWNQEQLGLAWSDDTSGQHEIYFQRFDDKGGPIAPAARITDNSMSSLIPAIEPWGARFALAWNEFVASSGGHDGRSEIAFTIAP